MLKSRYFMKINWDIFREKRCLYCLSPFTPPVYKKDLQAISTENYIQYHLCPQCAGQVQKQKSGFCLNCGEILPDKNIVLTHCGHCLNLEKLWDSFSFFGRYETIFREIILKAKFNHNRSCMKFLGELLAIDFLEQKAIQALQENQEITPKELHIIPMPLHEKRLRERGANQCIEIIGYFIDYLHKNSHYSAILHKNILKKSRHTIAQSSLDKKERQRNIKNSFALDKDFLSQNKNSATPLNEIILFDDIATTNSTLKESCKELKRAGIEKIHVLILAKA